VFQSGDGSILAYGQRTTLLRRLMDGRNSVRTSGHVGRIFLSIAISAIDTDRRRSPPLMEFSPNCHISGAPRATLINRRTVIRTVSVNSSRRPLASRPSVRQIMNRHRFQILPAGDLFILTSLIGNIYEGSVWNRWRLNNCACEEDLF